MHPRQDLSAAAASAASGASEGKAPLIALAGSANSGKTTLFNLLTGSHYSTVNYPGATVEFALGACKQFPGFPCRVMDTPGLTSLIPASLDEQVTVDALFHGANRPDLVVAVVDANQLSRHLYLVRQLQDLGFALIVVITMGDLLRKRGRAVDSRKLSQLLDCPVVAMDPRRKEGLGELGTLLAARYRQATGGPGDYAAFSASMTEERVQGYYRALDEIEALASSPAGMEAPPAPVGAPVFPGGAGLPAAPPGGGLSDRVLLHPFWGLAIFLLVMCAVFTSIFWLASPFMDLIDGGFGLLIAGIKRALPASWITDLIADGLVGGAGAVLVFLPQIVILFFAMGWLEDSGYLARGAALVDKPLSKIGLNGKSFVPLLSGYACAIPAMMAARTIPNRFERNLTIFIIPLLSCSARLPVYTLLLAFLTPADKPWIGGLALTGLYVLGMVIGAAVSTLISRFRRNREPSGFILELPAMKRPVFSIVVTSTYHKAEQYIRKAGITIVVISLGLWVLTHTPAQGRGAPGTAASSPAREYVAMSHSYAAQLGRFIEPVTRPMGLDWRGGVAMMCGFAAREVFVSAMALVYRVGDAPPAAVAAPATGVPATGDDGLTDRLLKTMREARFEDTGERIFTTSSGLGIIVFFLIALQCFPTVAVSRNETGGWKLPMLQLVAYTGGAYLLAVITVQALRALGVA